VVNSGSTQRLWQRHKYSVLARDERVYRAIGPAVARGEIGDEELAVRLESLLARPPNDGGLRNAVEHMWGHVSEGAQHSRAAIGDDPFRLLEAVAQEARRQDNEYLLEQTALTELFDWQDG
jgi:hypothetical protein